MNAFLPGFLLGLSLIAVIGAQNAFVLRQGLQRQHVFAVCLTCAASDALLVTAGIAGFDVMVSSLPGLELALTLAGALFLMGYAGRSFRSALTECSVLSPSQAKIASLSSTIAACLAFTWLNPHVYLDTVVLLGSVSIRYADERFTFGLGAVGASFVVFLFSRARSTVSGAFLRPARVLAPTRTGNWLRDGRAGCQAVDWADLIAGHPSRDDGSG